jgi:hypothetical protein
MKERTYAIRGVAPLITHNAQLSDPLNKWAKSVAEISKKRSKTEADLHEMARREWFGGLYVNDEDTIVFPCANIERMIRDAATKTKMGRQVQAAVIVPGFDLHFEFPEKRKKLDSLWKEGKHSIRASCKVGQKRVIRTRPMFPEWSVEFTLNFDEEMLNASQIDEFITLAARIVGLCEWRPKYGRFEVTEIR